MYNNYDAWGEMKEKFTERTFYPSSHEEWKAGSVRKNFTRTMNLTGNKQSE